MTLELRLERTVDDLVVGVDELVAETDAGVEDDQPRRMADGEAEHLSCLPAQRMVLRKDDIRKMQLEHVAERQFGHAADRPPLGINAPKVSEVIGATYASRRDCERGGSEPG